MIPGGTSLGSVAFGRLQRRFSHFRPFRGRALRLLCIGRSRPYYGPARPASHRVRTGLRHSGIKPDMLRLRFVRIPSGGVGLAAPPMGEATPPSRRTSSFVKDRTAPYQEPDCRGDLQGCRARPNPVSMGLGGEPDSLPETANRLAERSIQPSPHSATTKLRVAHHTMRALRSRTPHRGRLSEVEP